MRGGEADTLFAAQQHNKRDTHSPSLTDADTVIDDYTSEKDIESTELFKLRSQLTFSERHIIDLKRDVVNVYTHATKAERLAQDAAIQDRQVELDELRIALQQLQNAQQEKDAALAMQDRFWKEAEQAKEEAEGLRIGLLNTESLNQNLVAQLEEARNARPGPNSGTISQLHTTITARDTKIEQLIDKYDKLMPSTSQG